MIHGMRLYKRYKKGKFLSYYVELPNDKRKSLKTKDKTKARRAYRIIENEILKGRVARFSGKSTKRMGDFAKEYKAWAKDAIIKKSTRRANILALNKLLAATGENLTLDAVGQKHIDLIIQECRKNGNKTGSINNYIRHAKTVMNKTVDWDYIDESPLKNVKELRQEKKLPGFIEKQDISRVIKSVKDVDLRRYIVAYIVTGRRRSELVYLRWENVNLKTNRYTPEVSKSRLQRVYAINGVFRSVLESIGPKKEGRVFDRWKHPDTVSHKVKEGLISAGHGHLTLHSLRHTYASMKATEGYSLKEIQELLGQSDIKATQIYAHLTQDHLAEIAEVNIGPVDLGKN